MESTFSNDFKKNFLLVFTKELIAHSAKVEIIQLQRIIESKEKNNYIASLSLNEKLPPEKKVYPTQILNKKPILLNQPSISSTNIQSPPKIGDLRKINPPEGTRLVVRQFNNQSFNIPEPKLPPHLEYLKPTPVSNTELDLLKLNPLMKDPAVKTIIGSPDEKVTVTGIMGTKPTAIVLSKEDIDRIIDIFSEKSKIPANEGIYKVAIGNLVMSAIISKSIGSRFIIKKMPYYPPEQLKRKI